MESSNCIIHLTGLWPYPEAQAWQREIVERLRDNPEEPEHLILLEHPPVFTIGRSGSPANILCPKEILEREGIEVFPTERGGDVTYHGPGQIVGYPILRLDRRKKDVHWYLRQLEEVIIRALGTYGLSCRREAKFTGVWVGEKKICAIGVAISKWITFHGWALNVTTNLSHFSLINPCGITDRPVTSLYAETGIRYNSNDIEKSLVEAFAHVFEVRTVMCDFAECTCRRHA